MAGRWACGNLPPRCHLRRAGQSCAQALSHSPQVPLPLTGLYMTTQKPEAWHRAPGSAPSCPRLLHLWETGVQKPSGWVLALQTDFREQARLMSRFQLCHLASDQGQGSDQVCGQPRTRCLVPSHSACHGEGIPTLKRQLLLTAVCLICWLSPDVYLVRAS